MPRTFTKKEWQGSVYINIRQIRFDAFIEVATDKKWHELAKVNDHQAMIEWLNENKDRLYFQLSNYF